LTGIYNFECGTHILHLSERTHIMGIVNVTPDSFFDGGLYLDTDKALDHAIRMIEQGADIIDVGGESTRPGADTVPAQEEKNRVVPLIEKIRKNSDIPISIDTRKSDVAKAALDAGASIINDVSGLNFDPNLVIVASKYKSGLVLMHMKGDPKSMQKNPVYNNLIDDIIASLKTSIQTALDHQIAREKILIDPGIGFGKKWEDNYIILNQLEAFQTLGYPLLIGLSRKSFIGRLLNLTENERMLGTAVANAIAIYKGAHIIRVHDVPEMVQTARIVDQIRNL